MWVSLYPRFRPIVSKIFVADLFLRKNSLAALASIIGGGNALSLGLGLSDNGPQHNLALAEQ
jgi:hypothetical protein